MKHVLMIAQYFPPMNFSGTARPHSGSDRVMRR